ncbi:host specificity factor TipJ family phage tail protein [Anaeroselena agilis]|uniref:Host specificity factor TipJ family phage tail protein n=1 Tax=Anaeroselena agilis TaxID=3063788 RepID=A0ABU3NVZ2_9FIRM|nr:host specificity factor TipJ family phage tail protein [Selenomonadales bacterium 4137-cl]
MAAVKLIFVRNPVTPDKREIKYVDAGPTIAEHIAPIIRLWPDTDFSVSVNGHRLEKEEWDTLVPGDEDSVVVHPVLAKGLSNFFRAVFDIAVMTWFGNLLAPLGGGSTFMQGLWRAVGTYIGGRIANAILPPPKQQEQQQSTTYGWNGPQPTAKPGTPVAKTYGTVRISPVLLCRFVTSDGNSQFLNLLYSGGEGPVDSIDNILIDGNPIGNYTNVTYDIRFGTNDQTPIPNFNDTVTDYELGYELDTAGDWSTQQTIGNTVQGLQITVEFPYGLAHINDDGGLGTASVTVEAQYRLIGTTTWTEWPLTNGGTTSNSKNTSLWTAYRIDNLTPGQYVVRVRCAGKSGTSTRDLTRVFWITLSEIIYDDFAYPNRVLVGIRALATNQLSSSDPTVTWEQTRSTVYVLNPNTGQYEQKRASNPYWACYDLIHGCKYLKNIHTGKYEYCIDGNPASRIDYNAFTAAAVYADGKVNGDYRFSLNIYLSEDLSFWDALARLAIVGRGAVIPKGTLYSCICDMPGTSTQLFTVGNITQKSFKGQFESTKDRATSVEVTFYNKEKNYAADEAVYYGPGYESSAVVSNPVRTTYYGITDYRHAYAEAAYLSRCNQYLVRTENWEADIDAIACTLGDIVDVQHDIPKWGDAGGRIVSATETTVTLDKEVTLLANQPYAIKIRLYTDEIIDAPVSICGEDMTTDKLTVVTPFATIPRRYDVYAFGPVGRETKPFKVVGIAKSGDQKVKITGVEYVAAVYDEKIGAPVVNYSSFDTSPVEVTGLSGGEETYMQTDGTIVSVLHVSWAAPKNSFVAGYSVWYSSDNGGSWLLWAAGIRSANTTILNVKALATYLVKVSTVNGIGVVSPGVISEPFHIAGKITPPASVEGFTYQEVTGGFLLSWQANSEIDLAGYNVYQGANNVSMDASVLIADKIMNTCLFVPVAQAGQYAFHIVAIDTSGNVSPAPATILASFSVPPDVQGFDVVRIGDDLDFRWQPVSGANITYEIRRGASWELGQRIGRTTSPYYRCLFPTPGDHSFWIKAIDSYGNYSVNAQNNSVVIVDSGNRNAVITIDQAANGWTGASLNTYVHDGGLQLADGAIRGQHIVEVDIGKSFTARSTILADMIGVKDTGITWGSANFTWDDAEAQTPWEPDGDITGITLDHQISLFKGIPLNIIESLSLDGTADGDLGTPAQEAVQVTYASGRFRQGAFVQDLTKLSWGINIPAIYNVVFYVSVTQPIVDNVVYMTFEGAGGRLLVGYDASKGVFYLADHLGNRNEARVEFKSTDWLTFGIVQTQTTRKLYVYSFSANAAGNSEAAYGPVGNFTAVFLYPKLN